MARNQGGNPTSKRLEVIRESGLDRQIRTILDDLGYPTYIGRETIVRMVLGKDDVRARPVNHRRLREQVTVMLIHGGVGYERYAGNLRNPTYKRSLEEAPCQ